MSGPVVPAPASPGQYRIWFATRLATGGPLHSICLAWRLRGPVHAGALEQAVGELVRRQAVLRTGLRTVRGELLQEVHAEARPEFTISAPPAGPDPVAAARTMAEQYAARPFDLEQPPLLRIHLIRLDDADTVLQVVVHHTVFDGRSAEIFCRELEALYAQALSGRQSGAAGLPELTWQYADYARDRHALGGAGQAADTAFWHQALAATPPLVALPLLAERAGASTVGAYTKAEIDVAEGLRRLCREERCTPFTILITAFAVLIAKVCDTDAVRIGTASAGRPDPRTHPLIGMFANTLLLPFRVASAQSFRDVLKVSRKTILQGLTRQEVPLERVLDGLEPDRDRTAPPIQIGFSHRVDDGEPLRLAGLSATPFPVDTKVCEHDLALTVTERGDILECWFDYRRELLSGTWVAGLAELYTDLLAAVTSGPDISVENLRLRTLDGFGTTTIGPGTDSGPGSGSGTTPAALEEPPLSPDDGSAPADALEEILATVWSSVLGTTVTDVTADFFSIGGNSALALKMTDELEAFLGATPSLGLVFQALTIRSMAEGLRAQNPSTVAVLAEAARAADRPPPTVYCVHPVGGSVEGYRGLADLLADEFTTLGLLDRALLDGAIREAGIAERAAEFAVEIKGAGGPPCVLVGWSLGALIAHEIAAELGPRFVRAVVLVDPPDPRHAAVLDEGGLRAMFSEHLVLSGVTEQKETDGQNPETFEHLYSVYRANTRAAERHRPSQSQVATTIAVAGEGRPDAEQATEFWRGVCSGPSEVVHLAGDHFTVLSGQGLTQVAHAVRAAYVLDLKGS